MQVNAAKIGNSGYNVKFRSETLALCLYSEFSRKESRTNVVGGEDYRVCKTSALCFYSEFSRKESRADVVGSEDYRVCKS